MNEKMSVLSNEKSSHNLKTFIKNKGSKTITYPSENQI